MNTQTSYDAVADEYVRRNFHELKDKPFDRELLDRFAERVRGRGTVCDLGCGPGQVARYLHERGVAVCGVDLSPALVERARRLTPAVEFRAGDMRALDVPDNSWAGIAAFYSLIHIPAEELVATLCELRRVLRPGGGLLIAFHIGAETIRLDEWWGVKVGVDFRFLPPAEMRDALAAAGLVVEGVAERDPYPDVEYTSRRCYVTARKPTPEG